MCEQCCRSLRQSTYHVVSAFRETLWPDVEDVEIDQLFKFVRTTSPPSKTSRTEKIGATGLTCSAKELALHNLATLLTTTPEVDKPPVDHPKLALSVGKLCLTLRLLTSLSPNVWELFVPLNALCSKCSAHLRGRRSSCTSEFV